MNTYKNINFKIIFITFYCNTNFSKLKNSNLNSKINTIELKDNTETVDNKSKPTIEKKKYDNFQTINNFVHNDFFHEKRHLLDEYKIYYDENIIFSTFEYVNDIQENHFLSIIRRVYPDKLTITWSDDNDLYIVLHILFCSYLENNDSLNLSDVIINQKTFTKIDKKLIQEILLNDIKSLEIVYTGNLDSKIKIYTHELCNFNFIVFFNDPTKTTHLVNMEWSRLGKLKYMNLL